MPSCSAGTGFGGQYGRRAGGDAVLPRTLSDARFYQGRRRAWVSDWHRRHRHLREAAAEHWQRFVNRAVTSVLVTAQDERRGPRVQSRRRQGLSGRKRKFAQ